jgi:hypothetical protein
MEHRRACVLCQLVQKVVVRLSNHPKKAGIVGRISWEPSKLFYIPELGLVFSTQCLCQFVLLRSCAEQENVLVEDHVEGHKHCVERTRLNSP